MTTRPDAHRRWLAARAAEQFVGPVQPTPQELAQAEWERRPTASKKVLD